MSSMERASPKLDCSGLRSNLKLMILADELATEADIEVALVDLITELTTEGKETA